MLEILPHRVDALVVEAVQAASPLRPIGNQPGLLQQTKVAGYRRAADRQLVGELPNGPVADTQQLDDGPAIGVTERIERISAEGIE